MTILKTILKSIICLLKYMCLCENSNIISKPNILPGMIELDVVYLGTANLDKYKYIANNEANIHVIYANNMKSLKKKIKKMRWTLATITMLSTNEAVVTKYKPTY